ncbi:MAG: ribose-5-phosphate isomerase RpiA [Chlamydiales bacterium]|nr:ribose-5-phosphate isomerase RpiA [Chlamydiales bacterium]
MDEVKDRIGKAAAALVEDGMVVGLGTGSTAACFIKALASRYETEGINIVTVASSYASEKLARELGLPAVSIDAIDKIDLYFDGADEIDPSKQMIKGAGGALLKEKILASNSQEFVCMVDESKLVETIGKVKLPVEVVQFAHNLTCAKLAKFGTACVLRIRGDGKPFITDSGHFVYDLQLNQPLGDIEALDSAIRTIAGVVETGLFYKLAGRVVIGYTDGQLKILT